MRYRKLTPEGDYAFGTAAPFLIDTPEAVAQAVLTRMRLLVKEWFLDQREGLDTDLILGYGTQGTRDLAIQQRVRGTPGFLSFITYASSVDESRKFTVTATINTIYGQADIEATF